MIFKYTFYKQPASGGCKQVGCKQENNNPLREKITSKISPRNNFFWELSYMSLLWKDFFTILRSLFLLLIPDKIIFYCILSLLSIHDCAMGISCRIIFIFIFFDPCYVSSGSSAWMAILSTIAEVYIRLCQTDTMKPFAKEVSGFIRSLFLIKDPSRMF